VCQYVESALLLLQAEQGVCLSKSTLGIVGVGHVGSLVEAMARSWGMRVLCCDPPRAEQGDEGFVSLEVIAREADIITLHTPLTREGRYPTFHMADAAFFDALERKPWLINTSRGETVDTEALHHALDKGQVAQCIIDVWEHEPHIDLALLERCYIGTPHIAGYSADGKACATQMALQALQAHFALPPVPEITPPAPHDPEVKAATREQALIQIYNPHDDSRRLKDKPEAFEWLRGNYPLRREAKGYVF
jgi:erythronate-4-phosphate dehydrogenase